MSDLSDLEFFYYALIAIGAGALIGLEREHHRDEMAVLAGVRTFSLISLLGFITAFLVSVQLGLDWLVIAGFLVVGFYGLLIGYIKFQKGSPGITTPVAMMVAFFAGVMVGYQLLFEAAVLTVATTFLLVSQRRTHGFARILDDDELIGALQFLTLAVIIYPLTYGMQLEHPWDLFNRGGLLDLNFTLLLVVIVSALSFVSFLIIRKEGASRGLEFSGLLGGLINSEATAASICNLVKGRKDLLGSAVSGIMLASGIMFLRNLIILLMADPSMEAGMWMAIPALICAGAAMALGFPRRADGIKEQKLDVKSPFSIRPAIKFAIMILAISLASYGFEQVFGESGVYVSAIGGLVSSAAVAASLGSLVFTGNLDPIVAAQTVMIASSISCLNKVIIARSVDRDIEKALKLKIFILAGLAVAGAAALITYMLL
ncbi:MAG TPA: MgtC/SapB family protein [Methanomassiliicoccales archaeon]|nr:MgtC/SapB family protein [Methanomassiliicoccales archaeon]